MKVEIDQIAKKYMGLSILKYLNKADATITYNVFTNLPQINEWPVSGYLYVVMKGETAVSLVELESTEPFECIWMAPDEADLPDNYIKILVEKGQVKVPVSGRLDLRAGYAELTVD